VRWRLDMARSDSGVTSPTLDVTKRAMQQALHRRRLTASDDVVHCAATCASDLVFAAQQEAAKASERVLADARDVWTQVRCRRRLIRTHMSHVTRHVGHVTSRLTTTSYTRRSGKGEPRKTTSRSSVAFARVWKPCAPSSLRK
jgi:hypothetical protein